MTSGQLAAVTAALGALSDYIGTLETRMQAIVEKAERIAAAHEREHLRDEDVTGEVIRPGDHLRVATNILIAWVENAGQPTSLPVQVKHITVEADGTKTLIVGVRSS